MSQVQNTLYLHATVVQTVGSIDSGYGSHYNTGKLQSDPCRGMVLNTAPFKRFFGKIYVNKRE